MCNAMNIYYAMKYPSKTYKFNSFAVAKGVALRTKFLLRSLGRGPYVWILIERDHRLKADDDTPLLPPDDTQFPVFE